MKEYLLLFRRDLKTASAQPATGQMELFMNQWTEWIGSIEAEGKLAPGGNHLSDSGVLIRPGNEIRYDIYVADRESLTGYIVIFADGTGDAVEIAKRCPLLNGERTSIEIRETSAP